MSEPIDRVEIPTVAIDWYRSFPWWRLGSRAVTISWRISHLVIGTAAVIFIALGWGIANRLFGSSDPVPSIPNESPLAIIRVWKAMVLPLLSFRSDGGIVELARIVFGGIATAAVCASAGALLARRSVIELGTQSASDWSSTIGIVKQRFPSLLWTLSMPWCAIALLAMPTALLGLVSRMGSFGEWIAGVSMIPMVLIMIGAGWLALLGLLGFPLAVTAVVAEKHADAFDGFSRSAAYLFQKPVTYALSIVIAGAIATAMATAIDLTLHLGRGTIFGTFELFSGKVVQQNGEYLSFGFRYAERMIDWLARGFQFSFFWAAAAAIYLTLRNETDRADFDELDLNDKLPKKSIPDLGLPPTPENNPALSGVHEQAE